MHDRTRAALRLESRAVELGARKAELLHVSVPSHCPLLQPIAKSLRGQLRSMQIRDPQFVYVSNVKARAIRSAVGIATDLADKAWEMLAMLSWQRWDATHKCRSLKCTPRSCRILWSISSVPVGSSSRVPVRSHSVRRAG
jgi:hypothetical protein